jgi:penicillin G amidase
MRIMNMGNALGVAALVSVGFPAIANEAPAAVRGAQHVSIYRDAMGVPHVFADDAVTVMFGWGYAEAQDRLAALELQRRAATGRRAEILGPSMVRSDKTARDRLLDPSELMRMYRAIPPESQAMMQAFVDGINRTIGEALADPDHKLPIEFARWGIKPTPWTLIDFLNYVASVPSGRGGYELQNLAFLNAMIARYGEQRGREIFDDVVPISDPDTPLAIPPGEDLAPRQPMPVATHLALNAGGIALAGAVPLFSPPPELRQEASRCLVIGPKKSASGRVLMMEATSDGPEVHLNGGGFDSTGFSFTGWGAPFMGRGPQHGWLMTSGHADTTDTFAERLNPANKYQYWFKGAWKTMTHRRDTIAVKGAAPVIYEVAATLHGPVVEWDTARNVAYTQRYAMRGKELDNWVGIVEMARAQSLADFEKKGIERVGWNLGICYGGEDGQIGFWEAGTLPKRAPGADSRLPTPGTGDYEWTGFLTAAEHPHMLNPKQGYIHAWNSKATTWSREGDDARIGATFRTYLGSRLAATTDPITLLDMREFNRKIFNAMGARDRTQTSPDFFAPYIRAAIASTTDSEVRQAGELMLSYNGRHEDLDYDDLYDNAGLTLFRTWLEVAPDLVFGDDIGNWWKKVDDGRYLKYQTSLLLRVFQGKAAGAPLRFDFLNGKDVNAVMVETIRRTVTKLKPQFVDKAMSEWRLPVFWKYFDPARRTPDRPALPGDTEVGPARLSATLGLSPAMVRHNGGEGWVGLMEIGPDRPVLYSVVETGGQSQFIDVNGKGNPHLTDQTMMHETNEFKRTVMAPEEVRRTAISKQDLAYSPPPIRP